MTNIYDNLFLSNKPENISYTSKNSGGKTQAIPPRDRIEHGNKLQQQLEKLWETTHKENSNPKIAALPKASGTYLEFVSTPEFDLCIKSLENRTKQIKLLNVRQKIIDDSIVELATVFVPKGCESYFSSKISEYIDKNTVHGNPKNKALIESIEEIKLAIVESFFPENHLKYLTDKKEWFEIWLSSHDQRVEENFRTLITALELSINPTVLTFPERKVVLVKANKNDLEHIISYNDSIAEIRKAAELVETYLDLDNTDQLSWVDDINSRILDSSNNIVINIIDSGIQANHKLLSSFITEKELIALDSNWNKFDITVGHGTKMAGIALYNNLLEIVESNETVEITHTLESSKIYPDQGHNDPELYGYTTQFAISEQIINNPDKIRINCLAVSSTIDAEDGKPSSWSAAIDEITSGAIDNKQKLIVISAGNIESSEWLNYPHSNYTSSIHNPGQSWNALTIGAYTERVSTSNLTSERSLVASPGTLSPASTTSVSWDDIWPIKPEIVMEGGNAIKDSQRAYEDENLSALTLSSNILTNQFSFINSTSEAAAHASHLTAKILYKYPNLRPETVKALIVNSADWTDAMKREFITSGTKSEYRNLLRTYGYGVPNLSNAINSIENNVNLIIESELQPYEKSNSKYKTKDMHLHELPIPKELLLNLGETPVELKITLCYFIEPGPGEKGWKNRYRYPSSLLRFDLNGHLNREEFLSKINKEIESEDEDSINSNVLWTLGVNNRNKGSIHSDIWKCKAADLATSNLVGIYPAIGWWRERHWLKKYNNKLKYSLVVSLKVNAEVDIYNPISTLINSTIDINL